MRHITKTVYTFDELQKDVQQKVIDKHYAKVIDELQNEQYPFLAEYLKEKARELLKENNIKYEDFDIYYRLSYSQGDGLCLDGNFTRDEITLKYKQKNTHAYASLYSASFKDIEYEDVYIEENEKAQKLYEDYVLICKSLEQTCYSILEYRMSIDEFTELAKANKWEYYENGDMF